MMDNDFQNAPAGDARMPVAGAGAARKDGWEREVLEKLAFATLREQRARRRWNIFFRLTFLALVIFALWRAFGLGTSSTEVASPHTALIEIDGAIVSGGGSGDADSVIPALNRAFTDAGSVGIILRINSP